MNLARRFNAGKAPVGETRRVATTEFKRRYATRFCLSRITSFEKPG